MITFFFGIWPILPLSIMDRWLINLLSEFGPDGKSYTQQHLRALKEDRVPDLQHGVMGQTSGKHGQKPLHGEDVGERRLIAAWNTMQLTWNRQFFCIHMLYIYTGLLHTFSFPIGYFLEMVEMLRKFCKLQAQQISEHGHVHWEGTQVIGEVTIGKHFINQIDHHLSKNNNKRMNFSIFSCLYNNMNARNNYSIKNNNI